MRLLQLRIDDYRFLVEKHSPYLHTEKDEQRRKQARKCDPPYPPEAALVTLLLDGRKKENYYTVGDVSQL